MLGAENGEVQHFLQETSEGLDAKLRRIVMSEPEPESWVQGKAQFRVEQVRYANFLDSIHNGVGMPIRDQVKPDKQLPEDRPTNVYQAIAWDNERALQEKRKAEVSKSKHWEDVIDWSDEENIKEEGEK